jgi:hypothetical protein
MIVHEASYGEAHNAWTNSYGSTYRIKGAMFHPDIVSYTHALVGSLFTQSLAGDYRPYGSNSHVWERSLLLW